MVPRIGLEPIRLATPAPEAGASTNFATWACRKHCYRQGTHIIYENKRVES